MKNWINIKSLLLVLGMGLFSIQLAAQSGPMYIVNSSNCYVYIDYVEAYSCPSTVCYASPNNVCLAPGDVATVNPCGNTTFQWAIGAISLADANCTPCGSLYEVQQFVSCYSSFNPVQFPGCGTCSGAVGEWIASNIIEIK